MADVVNDTYVHVNPDGSISFDFQGVIYAQGLVLDEQNFGTGPIVPSKINQAAWQDVNGVVRDYVEGYRYISANIAHLVLALDADVGGTGPEIGEVRVLAGGPAPLAGGAVILDGNALSDFYLLPAKGAIADGTAGQVLTSNGAGVNPSFQAVAAGGTVVRAQGSTSSSTPGTVVADLIAAANTKLTALTIYASSAATSSTYTITVTYSDATTTSLTAVAGTCFGNNAGLILIGQTALFSSLTALSAKDITEVKVVTAGTGANVRAAVISAVQL